MSADHRPSLRWWAVAAVVVAVGVTSVLVARSQSSEPRTLAGAIAVATDDGRFTSSPRAAEALAEISGSLVSDARSCAERNGKSAPACTARASAAAIAQSAAVTVLRCTQPGVHEARTGVLTYLQDVARLDREPHADPPRFPDLPVC